MYIDVWSPLNMVVDVIKADGQYETNKKTEFAQENKRFCLIVLWWFFCRRSHDSGTYIGVIFLLKKKGLDCF